MTPPDLPTGIVTFLFTDIEGSTGLLQALGAETYGHLQDAHSVIMREAIDRGRGVEIRTEGDAFFAVFGSPAGALLAATEAQSGLAAHAWPDGSEIRVRIGMHTGEGSLGGDDYLGIDVNRAARIAAVGHGGQVVLSNATAGLVEQTLPDGVVLRDLGLHRLKDFPDPLRLYDLVIPGLPSDFAQLRTLDARPTNLPAERTSFVGREEQVARLEEMLGGARLVTIVGPGGTGKTRLSIRVASQVLDRFADGAFFVDLSAVTDPEVVLPEIASALKVRRDPGQDTADALRAHLRDRELLLVLDNMEQVVEAASAVGILIDGSPGLTVLATSRIPLQLVGEQRFALQPMPVPGTMPPMRRRSMPFVCSRSGPPPCILGSDSTNGRRPPSSASWPRSTAFRSRWSWRRAGWRCSVPTRWPSVSRSVSRCSPEGRATPPSASGRWLRRSRGVTTSSTTMPECCSRVCRCSPVAPRWRRPNSSRGRASTCSR